MSASKPFWEHVPLAEMTDEQWESLCDGCGKCCLHKLEDEDDGEVYYTNIACRYMNDNCLCDDYQQRSQLVPECLTLKPEKIASFHWLPKSCSYRLLTEQQPLPSWHHLITGSKDTIHEMGQSVKNKVLSETAIDPDDYQEHVIHWID